MALAELRATRAPMNERSLRRAARAHGLVISKSHRRDPDASGFGRWAVADAVTGAWIAGVDEYGAETMTFAAAQAWLLSPGQRRRNGRGR